MFISVFLLLVFLSSPSFCTSLPSLFSSSLLSLIDGDSTVADPWHLDCSIMTGPTSDNMPQRKVNSPQWQYRYRQCHPSEAGGAWHDNNWLYISLTRINYKIISAYFSCVKWKLKWAAFAPLRDKIYDSLSSNQTTCTNTISSLFIQDLWRVFLFFLPSSMCIIHHTTWMELFQCGRHVGVLAVSCCARSWSSWESWDPLYQLL